MIVVRLEEGGKARVEVGRQLRRDAIGPGRCLVHVLVNTATAGPVVVGSVAGESLPGGYGTYTASLLAGVLSRP
jgi:hypothetical protein